MKRTISLITLATAMMAVCICHSAPLTQSVNTPQRGGAGVAYLVTSNTVVYGGAIAAIDRASGHLVPATDTSNLLVVGRIDITVDNGYLALMDYRANKLANVSRGIFRWDNGDSFTSADVGNLAYIADDHTVQRSATSAHAIPVGVILEVDADGVWVDVSSLARQLSGSVDTLSVSGSSAVGGSASVAGALTVRGAVTWTNGVYTITGLPTATNGLSSGRLWSNSGVISVMP